MHATCRVVGGLVSRRRVLCDDGNPILFSPNLRTLRIMARRNMFFKFQYPQIQIAQGRARLVLKDGGSSPYPMAVAQQAIDSGDYVYVGRGTKGAMYRHVADL